MAKKKTAPKQQLGLPASKAIDLNTTFNMLLGNMATIKQHCIALKLVAKGIDIGPLEKANDESQQLLVALANFVNAKQALPGKKVNRGERRRAERLAKTMVKKLDKKRRR